MKKAEENGSRFVPEAGGPLEALWKQKGYDKHSVRPSDTGS